MSRDFDKFPDDENGNVLWQMAEDGDDLIKRMKLSIQLPFKAKN